MPDKLVFFMPNAVVLKDFPRKPHGTFTHAEETFIVFRNVRVYPKESMSAASYEGDTRSNYFMEMSPGIFGGCGHFASDDDFRIAISRLPAGHVATFKAKHLDAIANPEETTTRMQAENAELRARRAEEREREEQARIQREAERAQKEEERLQSQAANFAAGSMIEWADFETLCNRHGIAMHIRTIGSARRRVSWIGIDRMRVQHGFSPDGVRFAVRDLKAALSGDSAVAA